MRLNVIQSSFVMLLAWSFIFGILYPVVVTGIAQSFMPVQANGSIVRFRDIPVGSQILGQYFSAPYYFWGRPSATPGGANNARASNGSNLGPSNPVLVDLIKTRIQLLRKMDPENPAPIPIDLVTASGSGLDPEISVAAAHYQIARIARVRHLKPGTIEALVEQFAVPARPYLWQEPRVNVLDLNLALDRLSSS
ncbi:MAG: hypothetical protein RL333_61 [Pseudomonadota bacterium]|jgi:K+-transporting ATPase ATPase C chain